MTTPTQQYLCPVCRAPIKRQLSRGLSLIRHFQIALLTLSLAGLVYQFLGPYAAMRSLLVYLPFWAIFEFLHWVQMRESLSCQVCDFDPMLYQRDWKRARSKVEQKMSKVHDDLEAQLKARIEKARQPRPSSAGSAATEASAQAASNTGAGVAKSLNSLDR